MHWYTYRALLPEEMEIIEQKTVKWAFDASVAIKCVPGATVEYFDDLGSVETPEYDLYEYDTTYGACPKAPLEELDPTPNSAPYH